MVTHSDIIAKAQKASENLFDLRAKGEVFTYHMKMLNAVLLLRQISRLACPSSQI